MRVCIRACVLACINVLTTEVSGMEGTGPRCDKPPFTTRRHKIRRLFRWHKIWGRRRKTNVTSSDTNTSTDSWPRVVVMHVVNLSGVGVIHELSNLQSV